MRRRRLRPHAAIQTTGDSAAIQGMLPVESSSLRDSSKISGFDSPRLYTCISVNFFLILGINLPSSACLYPLVPQTQSHISPLPSLWGGNSTESALVVTDDRALSSPERTRGPAPSLRLQRR